MKEKLEQIKKSFLFSSKKFFHFEKFDCAKMAACIITRNILLLVVGCVKICKKNWEKDLENINDCILKF